VWDDSGERRLEQELDAIRELSGLEMDEREGVLRS
jgi:hypothetical protein